MSDIIFPLLGIGLIIFFVIIIMTVLRVYLWWLLGIQRIVEQNDEIILLLKHIAISKSPNPPQQDVPPTPLPTPTPQPPSRPAINPLTKRP